MNNLSFSQVRGLLVASALRLTTGELAVRLALLGDVRPVAGCSARSLASRLAWLLLPPDYVGLELQSGSDAVYIRTDQRTGG